MAPRSRVYIIQPPVNIPQVTPCLDDQPFPLGLLGVGAYLNQNGFDAKGLHIPNLLANKSHSLNDLINEIGEAQPLLVAIALNWVHFSKGAIKLARLIRQNSPDIKIVIGGQHATLFTRQLAKAAEGCVDGIVNGEAERTLLNLCRHLENEGQMPLQMPGLFLCSHNQSHARVIAPDVVQNIDSLPFYDYSFLQAKNGTLPVATLSTGRGSCPLKCAFCLEHVMGNLQGRNKLHFHSPEWIVAHMKHIMDQGIKQITIQDNLFIGGDKMVAQIADEMERQNIYLDHINIFAHPNSFSETGFQAINRMAKLASIDFGVETGSRRVLELVNRPSDLDAVLENIRDAVKAGIVPYTWWLSGLPDAPQAEQDTCTFMKETMVLGAIPRSVNPLVLLPRTPMHERSQDYGIHPRFKRFEDYSLFSQVSLQDAQHFGDTLTHNTSERSRNDILEETKRLKQFILEHFAIIEKFWQSRHPLLLDELQQIKDHIQGSFRLNEE
ncbi:B12-binding domain-containing radical SAM protein [Terasakiella brassicae]|uniref:B12-binding domain-containing radical SAM protein n=1 Tax=Terasakiella brassicae TaxID=1634917 RepID=A0A917BT98_9PROT|nr:radical SAM protein [Terasakiella brassicae]GGF55940.1 B12-binding domain-containing radical SAM protein [Terasakiella brassicae]